jgi:hypothetical protein
MKKPLLVHSRDLVHLKIVETKEFEMKSSGPFTEFGMNSSDLFRKFGTKSSIIHWTKEHEIQWFI